MEALLKLSGMAYCSGEYTTQEWIEKTGVNPVGVAGVDIRNGHCYWTSRAERVCIEHFRQVQFLNAMLTGRAYP